MKVKTWKQINDEIEKIRKREYIGIESKKTIFAYFAGAKDALMWANESHEIKPSELIISKRSR